MSELPRWLPPLVLLEQAQGNWNNYCEMVYAIFRRDFIDSRPVLAGKKVACRRDPLSLKKEAGFWHCVSEGLNEQERTPDIRRCERIGWVRASIEHADVETVAVDVWIRMDRNDERVHIWVAEKYLVVLAKRLWGFQLITAFCTDRDHTVRKKRAERDAHKQSWRRPSGGGTSAGTPSTHGG